MNHQNWNHIPDQLPLVTNPLWHWPPQPAAAFLWWYRSWFPFTINLAIVALAVMLWSGFAPAMQQYVQPGWWIAFIIIRNLVVMTCLAEGLNWYFHRRGKQGALGKYDSRAYPRINRKFTFGNQYWDNVFWTLASGVVIWSLFESLLLWAMANGHAVVWHWHDGPAWFIAFFLLIPVWESFYFYWIHRLLHSRLFYRFHRLHHRNTDVGPWSGISMHPIEHLLYFGTAMIHFLLPSHPIHLIAHLLFFALYGSITHTGFEGLWHKGRKVLHLGNFHHQMHHRYFEVNYGTLEVPLDKVFGTYHDGSLAAHAEMRQRIQDRVRNP